MNFFDFRVLISWKSFCSVFLDTLKEFLVLCLFADYCCFITLPGSCILQYWNYAAVSKPCKCPMCVRHITTLLPEASLQERQEQEVKEVLAKIRRYNRLFVGGLTGFLQVCLLYCLYPSCPWLDKTIFVWMFQKFKELPLLIKRMVWRMMDPDTNSMYFHEVRIFAVKNILPCSCKTFLKFPSCL